ncbi:E3 ubiquitin-protein ligase MIB2-like isoform X1, partial [Leptotrombidium deliense]
MDSISRMLLETRFYGPYNLATMLQILTGDVDENTGDESENRPIHIATLSNHLFVLKMLVNKRVNVNIKNKDQNAALHIAVNKVYLEIVQFLLESGADVNAKNAEEDSVLFIAIKKLNDETTILGHLSAEQQQTSQRVCDDLKKIIELLIDSTKIDLTLFNKNGLNCLHYAIKLGNEFAFNKIVEKNASLLSLLDSRGYSNLHHAVENKRIDIVQHLLKAKQRENCDMQSMSPLHCAIFTDNLSAAVLLVTNGADCNAGDHIHRTPLHLVLGYLQSNQDGECEKAFIENPHNKIVEILKIFKDNLIPEKAHLVLAAYMIKHGNANLFAENDF